MPLRNDVGGATNYALQEAIGAYSDEAYMNAKKISGTGLTSANADIDTEGETYSGQLRWRRPHDQVINTASLTDSSDASLSSFDTGFLEYIKSARTHGAMKVNLKTLVTRDDELRKFARDLAETQAQDESNAIMAILKGVATAEALVGAGGNTGGGEGLGGQTFENDPDDAKYGLYVDLAGDEAVKAAPTTVYQGASRAEGFLKAMGMAWKDYEPEYAYLLASPETMMSLRSANMVDQDRVEDGKIMFNTIFQGKLRLIQTRANQAFTTAQLNKINTGNGVNITGAKTSFIVLPGAIAMEHLNIEEDVEIERKPLAYKGGGTTAVIYRWGYVMHPSQYTWAGDKDDFADDASYQMAVEGGTPTALTSVSSGTLESTTGTWIRKCKSALSCGILPVFHS